MNEIKLKNLLGLIQRAKLLVSGNFAVNDALKSGRVKAIILTTDASDATVAEFEKICADKKIKIYRALTKETLGQCLGRDIRAVAAVLDKGFAQSIEKIFVGNENNQPSVKEQI